MVNVAVVSERVEAEALVLAEADLVCAGHWRIVYASDFHINAALV